MKNIIYYILLLFFSVPALAQQDPMFSQYMFNPMMINPAYAGSSEVITVNALFRNQWINIPGAPTTGTVSIDAPVWGERMGLGLNVVGDRIGVTNTTGVYGYYAYRIKTGERSRLALGLSGGFSYYNADFQNVSLAQNPAQADVAFMNNVNLILPNMGVGIWFNTEKFYAGFSVPQLINNELGNDAEFVTSADGGARQYRHYFLSTGYVFDLSSDLKLKPSVLFKMVEGSAMQFDLNANLYFYDLIGIGASYRTGDSVIGIFDLLVTPQLRFSYAYDYTLTELREFNAGSHEIMLKYQFSFNKNKIITPRFF